VKNLRIGEGGAGARGQVFIFVCCGMIALLFYDDSNAVRYAVCVIM